MLQKLNYYFQIHKEFNGFQLRMAHFKIYNPLTAH